MKAIVLVAFISIFICAQLFSQTFDLRFIEIANARINGGNFDVKIQIKGGETFKLVCSNITINFLPGRINNPSLLVAHNFDDNAGGIYDNMTLTEPNAGVASINIVFPLTNSSFASDVPTIWKDVATIRFNIVDSTKTSSLNFRDANPSPTNIFKSMGFNGPPPSGTFVTSKLNTGTWYSLDVPLPVEITSFTASMSQNVVNLKWQTRTEANNYGFEIERKIEVTDSQVSIWEKIGFVAGSGHSISLKDYSFIDVNPSGGSKFIYRLKQLDLSGSFEYSDEVEIELVPDEFSLFQNYPNPFNPVTNIKFALQKAAKVTLLVYNLLGEKVVALLNEDKEAGFYDVQFNASNLSTGVYIYRLTAGDFIQTKKMTLIK